MRHCGHDLVGLDVTEVISRSFEGPGTRVSLQDVNRIMRLTVPSAPSGAWIDLQPPAWALTGCAYVGGLRTHSNTFL
jgi:hypothetical protein